MLTEDERAALYRPASASVKRVRWTPMDAVLLDELAALLDGVDTYVHVVVDEAQDLSADAVPGGGAALPARVDHRAGRPGAGHHARGRRATGQ